MADVKEIKMTDEEMAEEYADECFKANDKNSKYYRLLLITGYLDGLAEGRKEVSYMNAEEYDKYLDVCRENAELKEKMGRADYRIAELKMQIDKMKNKLNCSKYHYSSCKDIVCKDWRMKDWKMGNTELSNSVSYKEIEK